MSFSPVCTLPQDSSRSPSTRGMHSGSTAQGRVLRWKVLGAQRCGDPPYACPLHGLLLLHLSPALSCCPLRARPTRKTSAPGSLSGSAFRATRPRPVKNHSGLISLCGGHVSQWWHKQSPGAAAMWQAPRGAGAQLRGEASWGGGPPLVHSARLRECPSCVESGLSPRNGTVPTLEGTGS